MRTQPLPDLADECFRGGEASFWTGHVELRPCLVQKTEVQLSSDLTADGVLDLREVEHHAVFIQASGHGHDQFIVMTMSWCQSTGAELSGIVVSGEFRQPVTVAGTEASPTCDDTTASTAMPCSRLRFSHVTVRPEGILMS